MEAVQACLSLHLSKYHIVGNHMSRLKIFDIFQDGDPPTPGTVESWYRGNKSSKEVYVRWDSGRRVNYRVGAHGKYDLYLLKDQ